MADGSVKFPKGSWATEMQLESWATASSPGSFDLAFLEPRGQAVLLRVLATLCASELNGIVEGNSRASGGPEEFLDVQADRWLVENVEAWNSTLPVVLLLGIEPPSGQNGGEAADGWRDGRCAAGSV